jgi:hypothetical protein
MSNVKFTKTATFIFPLLEIPKSLFECNVKDVFSRVKFNNRFLNAYLEDPRVNYKSDEEVQYVFVVVRNYRDQDFDRFYSTVTALGNYIDDYEIRECLVLIFKIPDSQKENCNKILKGAYSEIDKTGKQLILSNNFYSGKTFTLPLILNKAEVLKQSWEDRLSLVNDHINSPANLYDQEVWPIIDLEKQVFCDNNLSLLSFKVELTPSEEF